MKFFKYITNSILWLVIMIIAVMGFFGIKHTLIAKDSYQQTQPPVPFAYLKGTYKGVDYSVWESNNNPFENYCGVSELSKNEYKNPDNKYFIMNKAKLFGGAIKISCMKLNFDKKTDLCTSNHPIAKNAFITLQFDTVYDNVPQKDWDLFFTDFAKHIESQIPADQMPNLEQICKELRKQHNSHTTE